MTVGAHVAEPACWSWEPPSMAGYVPPSHVWSWQQPDVEYRIVAFHAGRCAICARIPRRMVTDHDYGTHMVRGLLCHRCNVSEGTSPAPVYALYRDRNPASILGIQLRYAGPIRIRLPAA